MKDFRIICKSKSNVNAHSMSQSVDTVKGLHNAYRVRTLRASPFKTVSKQVTYARKQRIYRFYSGAIISKRFRSSIFSYDSAPQFHCSNENWELLETSVGTQYYSWRLGNHLGCKILVLKHEGVIMGIIDKKWKCFTINLNLRTD